MNIACSYGQLPRAGTLLTADCAVCGEQTQVVLPDEQTAAHTGVDHRCSTGVVGPMWMLLVPPATAAQKARRAA